MELTSEAGYLFFWRQYQEKKTCFLGIGNQALKIKFSSPIHSCPLAVEEKQGVTEGVKVLIEIQCLKDVVMIQVRGHLLRQLLAFSAF